MVLIVGLLVLFVKLLTGGETTSVYASPTVHERFYEIYDEKMAELSQHYRTYAIDLIGDAGKSEFADMGRIMQIFVLDFTINLR